MAYCKKFIYKRCGLIITSNSINHTFCDRDFFCSLSIPEIEKEKLSSVGDGESCADGGGGGGSGGAGGVSASLTPAIWDKTIPYDGENFHLEYMDLDEFLLENQIPAALEEELNKSLEQEVQGSTADPEVSAAVPQVLGETEKAAEVRKIKGEDEGCVGEIGEMQVLKHTAGENAHSCLQISTNFQYIKENGRTLKDSLYRHKPLFYTVMSRMV